VITLVKSWGPPLLLWFTMSTLLRWLATSNAAGAPCQPPECRPKPIRTLTPPDYQNQLRRACRRPSYKFTGDGPVDYDSSEVWFPPYRRWAYSISELPTLKIPSDTTEKPQIVRSRGRGFKDGAKLMQWEEYQKKNGKRANKQSYDLYCKRFFREVHGAELLPADHSRSMPPASMPPPAQVISPQVLVLHSLHL
jgi:hypothetical protein